jgi:hypothetical protein
VLKKSKTKHQSPILILSLLNEIIFTYKIKPMKKLFVVLALAGMTATVSATAISAASKSAVVTLKGDPKKKKDKKSCCSADSTKSCCKDGKGKCADKKEEKQAPKN